MKRILSVLMALTMIFSTVAFAAPVQIDTVTTATEQQMQITPAESNLPDAQIAEEENYGTLIYNITFDGTETELGKNAKDISGYGYVNTEAGFPSATIRSTFDTTEIKDGAVHVKASSSYPRLVIETANSFPEGKYFVSTDFTNKCTDSERDMTYAYGDSWLGGLGVPVGDTKTITGVITYKDGKLTYNDKRSLDITKFSQLGFYTSIGDKGESSFVYDNIKLYYSPFCDVTFDCTANTTQTLETVTVSGGTKINVSDYKLDNTDTMLFAGWQDKDGNKVYGEVEITADTTLTAVWLAKEHAEYGTLIYNITFDGTETVLDGTSRDISGYGCVNTEAGFPSATLKSSFDTTEIKNGAAHVKASSSYPRLVINVTGSFPEGKYFVSTDFTNNCTDSERDMTYAYGDSWLGGLGVPVDDTKTITGVITYMDGKLTYNSKRTLTVAKFGQLDFYTSIGNKGKSSFAYDNIKLYYKAPVTVTFADSTGHASSVPAAVKMQNGDTLDLAAITCTSDNVAKSFDGWSYTDGGEVIVGNPVIEENKTLYAVWSDKITPKSYFESSIRVTDPSGIRFKASVKNETKDDEKTTEYGFIVTTEAHLGTHSADYLTLEHKDVFYISGVNYGLDTTSGKNVDRVYATDEINTYFTVVLYGIPAKKENYEQNIVVRPYIKYDGTNCYGEPIVRSVLDVAEAIRDGGYAGLDESGKKAVQDILTLCEKEI